MSKTPVPTQKSNSSTSSFSARLTKALSWLDDHILLIAVGFLFAFIPLYPKLPLFEAIPGYIVRVRLEDLFVVLTVGIWGIQWLRGKARIHKPLALLIGAYAVFGLLSTLSAIFITQTVPLQPLHVGKTVLHYLRYLQYFSIFFVTYSAVKTRRDLKILLIIALITTLGIGMYGFGQKHLYWPVYSTMNREFSKGIRLYLTEHARVQSTFGGHYDLAGYLVLALPLLLSGIYFFAKEHTLAAKHALGTNLKSAQLKSAQKINRYYWLVRTGLWLLLVLCFWLLMVSASRISLIAALFAAFSTLAVMSMAQYNQWSERLTNLVKRGVVLTALTAIMLVNFGADVYDRLLHTLEGYPEIHGPYIATTEHVTWLISDRIPNALGLDGDTIDRLLSGQFLEKPDGALSTEEAQVLVASDQRPTTQRPGGTSGSTSGDGSDGSSDGSNSGNTNNNPRPGDVYVDVPDIKRVATQSADGTISYTNVEVDRVYSDNALRYGLSLAIRLDTLWPQALQGFYRNPLLGSGYATLTKEEIDHFTEAESTDNNFLRTLGETGLLGFITFYGVVALALWQVLRTMRQPKLAAYKQALGWGFVAATIGILLNALYIDVFAASKIAFSYWALTALVLASLQLPDKTK